MKQPKWFTDFKKSLKAASKKRGVKIKVTKPSHPCNDSRRIKCDLKAAITIKNQKS